MSRVGIYIFAFWASVPTITPPPVALLLVTTQKREVGVMVVKRSQNGRKWSQCDLLGLLTSLQVSATALKKNLHATKIVILRSATIALATGR